MSHIRITRAHSLGLEAAKAATDRVAADLQEEHRLRVHWEGDTLAVHGTGVKGSLAVTENRVDVHVKLGLAMRLFRSVLEKEINEELDEHLAGRG